MRWDFALAFASDYGLLACLLLGSIVATTDPAAVIGIFKEVGAPRRLLTLVEGESLLNDAAAIAIFTVLVAAILNPGTVGPAGAVVGFLVSAIGGAVVGFGMGIGTTSLFRILSGWRGRRSRSPSRSPISPISSRSITCISRAWWPASPRAW